MNTHVSEEIKEKWTNYEFLGKPFKLRDGKTYMRARSKTFDVIHFYCLDTDFIWWHKEDIIDS